MKPKPIPVILLTGHLGAGKTTVMNHLLGLPQIIQRNPVLIINEFGRLGIDGKLIHPGPWERYELNKGSLFCICLKTDFLATLQKIANRVPPGVVLIEATGVADPCDLEQLIDQPHLAGQFAVEAGICVIDAPSFIPVAAFMRTAQRQAIWADGLVLNKCDLVTRGELSQLHEVLAGLNPDAPRIEVEKGQIPFSFFASCHHRSHALQPTEAPPASVVSISLKPQGIWDATQFRKLITTLTPHLLRLKGWVDFGGGPVYIEWAGGKLIETPERSTDPTKCIGLVVIGWNITEDQLRDQFKQAGTKTAPRFHANE